MNVERGQSSRLDVAKRFTVKNLFKAAETGDVDFLKEALNSQPTDYLLSKKQEQGNCNIIHVAANTLLTDAQQLRPTQLNLLTFIEVALENLFAQDVLSLLSAKEELCHNTPIHYAALRGWLPALRLLVDFYTRSFARYQSQSEGGPDGWYQAKPWLMKNKFGDTPLHTTLKESSRRKGEACALYFLDLDTESLCNCVNQADHTPLSLAIKLGFNRVTEKILESNCMYSLFGPDGFSVLHLVPTSSVKVCRVLLDKHPELLKENSNIARWSVLHKWAEIGKLWRLELSLKLNKLAVINMLHTVDHQGANPLHVAWMKHNVFFAQRLCDVYKQATTELPLNLTECSLWTMKDIDGNTPFHLALTNELTDEKVLLKIMLEDPHVLHICNNAGESPLFIAVYNGHEVVVSKILELPDAELIGMPLRGDGCTVLHVMFRCGGEVNIPYVPFRDEFYLPLMFIYIYEGSDKVLIVNTEKIGQLLVEKFWWLICSVDANGKTALQVSEQADVLWAKKLLSRWINVPFAIKRPDFDWVKASKRGHSSAIIAFINHYPNFLRICYQRKDTPLHHIELKSFKEYQDFLVNPLIKNMKNMCDHEDATPLHRALERKDILLTELLLTTDGVDRSIRDKNHKTASDLLASLCIQHQEWREMCVRIRINPWLRPTYVQPMKTNMPEMRQTLSVVAALLATLTFAAGFTVPGGFNNDTGEALMAKKAAFLVFILADTIAMCCSLLALVCLIWSMVCDIPDKSVILVDYCVVILMVALYGTLVAFMTGVFTVMSHLSLWAAIVVCIICSLVGISANKTILFKVLSKLIPNVNPVHRD